MCYCYCLFLIPLLMNFVWSDIQILSQYANSIYGSLLYLIHFNSYYSWNIQRIRSGNEKPFQLLRNTSLQQRVHMIGGFLLFSQNENE